MVENLNQRLSQAPNSFLGRLYLRLLHRSARNEFERARRVPSQSLRSDFPCLEATRAILQYSEDTSASFGNVSPAEQIVIAALCAHVKPSILFEFGTYNGKTILHLALNSPPEARIYTIDLDPTDPVREVSNDDTFYTQNVRVGEAFETAPAGSKIVQIFGDSTRYDASALTASVDLIFVDAGHAYELVKSDSQKALSMLRPGGVILWHDYFYAHTGVYTFLNELAGGIRLRHVPGTTLVYHIKEEQNGSSKEV